MPDFKATLPHVTRGKIACVSKSKMPERFPLSAALVTPIDDKQVYLASTDGRCAAIVIDAGTCHDGREHLLPAEVTTATPHKSKPVTLNGTWLGPKAHADEPEGRFPRLEDALPTVAPETCFAVSFDVTLLAKIAQAIGTGDTGGNVTLLIPSDIHDRDRSIGIAVTGLNGIGVLMPTMTGERYQPVAEAIADHAAKFNATAEAYRDRRKTMKDNGLDR